LLRQAQANNPASYAVHLERARLYLHRGNLDRAEREVDVGLRLWPGTNSADDEIARQDKRRLLLYRALLHEIDGERTAAIRIYRRLLTDFPDKDFLTNRIERLENEAEPSVLPRLLLGYMLDSEHEGRAQCPREHHGDGEQHHH
jgi:tetratricopeptide (TPR) repeat protein